ncbi:hypothetical protein DXG01_009830, partial [Tephrocybe rancida]
ILSSLSATLSSLLSTTSSTTLSNDSNVPETSTSSSSLLTTGSTTLSAREREVLTGLSNTIGTLPPLPPSLESLDAFSSLLVPLPPFDIDNFGSLASSQAKRSHKDKKPNPFLDLKVEEDARDEADILGEAEANDEFNDREDFSDEEPPTRGPLDEAEEDADSNDKLPVEDDEDLDVYMDDDEDRFPDNEHPSSARAISHKTLANHDDLEQWRALLARARERGRSYKLGETFDEGLDTLPPAMLYRVRVKEGYEETAAMVVANKLLTAGTAWAPSVKSIIRCVLCPTWIFIESSSSAKVNKLCANLSNIYL